MTMPLVCVNVICTPGTWHLRPSWIVCFVEYAHLSAKVMPQGCHPPPWKPQIFFSFTSLRFTRRFPAITKWCFVSGRVWGFCFVLKSVCLPNAPAPRPSVGIWPTPLLLQAWLLSHTLAPAGFKEAQWQKKHPRFKNKKQPADSGTQFWEYQVQLTVNLAASRERPNPSPWFTFSPEVIKCMICHHHVHVILNEWMTTLIYNMHLRETSPDSYWKYELWNKQRSMTTQMFTLPWHIQL